MDRIALEKMLDEGLALAEIGRRVGRHEATVAYWLKRHGLSAVHAETNAPKGGLAKSDLEPLVQAGMSTSEIGTVVGRSRATVRHWLREYGLKTVWSERREGVRSQRPEMALHCARHGKTSFRLSRAAGYRCAKCSAEAVSRRRRKVKRVLVKEAGGSCRICGYDRCVAALEFHHVDRASKMFSLSHRGVARSLARAREEAGKCVLLCANCHAEVESGVAALAGHDRPALQSDSPSDDHPG
ncbi:MAG TPA: helix-turn-helix domain-containing protein [Solirubrobacteraceae bacterium]|jgi:transposase|nr:helix-turn-helix domain-containing protein [Solirubrobacteraceae bacterium]